VRANKRRCSAENSCCLIPACCQGNSSVLDLG
jgi:hypothetical protein